MALFLQDGTPLLLQDGSELLLQSDNLAVVGPSDLTVRDEAVASFEVVAISNDPGSLTYQWYKDAVLIVGATDSLYSYIVDYPVDDGTTYYCEVTDSSGTVTSDTATLTVTKKPLVWTLEPLDTTVVEGTPASFTATADGHPTVTYQWYETTAGILVGETSTTLSLTPALADDANSYYCVATDGYTDTWQSYAGVLTVQEEAGLGDQDIRMKTPSGQWVKILAPIIRESVLTADSIRTPTPSGQSGAQRLVCTNTIPITVTLTGFEIGDSVTVIRTDALVTVDTGDAALINGQASQQLPSAYDVAQLVYTAAGWIAI